MGKEPLSPKHFHPHGIHTRMWKKVGLVFFPLKSQFLCFFFFPFSQDVSDHLPLYKAWKENVLFLGRGAGGKMTGRAKKQLLSHSARHTPGQIFNKCSQHSMNQSWRWLQLPE